MDLFQKSDAAPETPVSDDGGRKRAAVGKYRQECKEQWEQLSEEERTVYNQLAEVANVQRAESTSAEGRKTVW